MKNYWCHAKTLSSRDVFETINQIFYQKKTEWEILLTSSKAILGRARDKVYFYLFLRSIPAAKRFSLFRAAADNCNGSSRKALFWRVPIANNLKPRSSPGPGDLWTVSRAGRSCASSAAQSSGEQLGREKNCLKTDLEKTLVTLEKVPPPADGRWHLPLNDVPTWSTNPTKKCLHVGDQPYQTKFTHWRSTLINAGLKRPRCKSRSTWPSSSETCTGPRLRPQPTQRAQIL